MPHPTKTKRIGGKLFHLEDSGLKLSEARALASHLRRTEDKNARIIKAKGGREVWWAK